MPKGILPLRKTKIVCTIGPASNSRETIAKLIDAGMDVARLNFSHGTHDEHGEVLRLIREESAKADRIVAVFQDLCGPKVRIGELSGGEIVLSDGDTIALRLAESRAEIAHASEFDYVVVNDQFADALAELHAIVIARRLRREAQCRRYAALIGDLLKPE